MLATLFNMPKWLVALVALCVLGGYADQVHCKIAGCKTTVVAAEKDMSKDGDRSVPGQGDSDCQCDCHLTSLVFSDVSVPHVCVPRATGVVALLWIGSAPEAPCADIEHPPQLA